MSEHSSPEESQQAPGASAWVAPPQPPPSARSNRLARVHVIWVVVALVAAVGSGTVGFAVGRSSAQIDSAIKSSAAAEGSAACPGSHAAPGSGARLAGELLPIPKGASYLRGPYQRHVDSLSQYMSTLYPNAPFEKGRLVARCFQVAAQQGWELPSGEIVAVYLAKFGTPADAQSYVLSTQTADLADPNNKLHRAVSAVSDGILIEAPGLDKYGNTLSRLIGDQGDVAMIIQVFFPARLPSSSFATSLLRQQAARL